MSRSTSNDSEAPFLTRFGSSDDADFRKKSNQSKLSPTLNRRRENKSVLLWTKIKHLFTLRIIFYTIGFYVGEYPRLFLLLSMIISLTSFGMWKLTLRDSIQEGYTALDARSRFENEVMRQFSGASAGLMKVIVLLMAKDEGSMHRKGHFDEAEKIVNDIYNLTVKNGQRRMMYRRICEPYCASSKKLFFTFKKYFDINYKSAVKNHYYSDLYNLSYPFGSIWGVRVPLEKALFGVRLVNSTKEQRNSEKNARRKRFFGSNIAIDPNKTIETQITNMEHVSLIVLILYGNKDTPSKEADLSSWELGVYEWSKQYNMGQFTEHPLVRVLIFGTGILDMEINTSNTKLAPYFGAGFSSMIGFVALCVFSSAYYYAALDLGKILVGIGATLCPLLAITSTYGILSLMGSRINSLLFVMPFLIMGVGVDAAFLMVNSWQKLTRRDYSHSERLGLVYEEAVPSITITSITNVLSFTIGAITPTPEVRLFCFGTATSMGLTYVYQLVLFGPVLSLAAGCEGRSRRESKEDEDMGGWRKAIGNASQSLLLTHCKIVRNKYVATFILVATLLYWVYSISGVLELEPRLDATKILPKDSLLHEGNSILADTAWKEHLSPTFYVNIRFNMTDDKMTTQFWNMLKGLESLPRCKGHASSYVWFRDFVQKFNRTKEVYPYNAHINPKELNSFLRNDEYHFETSLKLSNNSGNLTIEAFFFNVAYTNVSNWDSRIDLMTKWREVIDGYPELNTTVYESGAMFVDQMLSLKRVTLQTALLTFLSMTAVCAIFMRNPCTVATASVSIASISTGVIGIMSKLSFELDPIVMASLLMTIGMSVDYIAHVAYHFQLDSKTKLVNGSTIQTAFEDAEENLEYAMRAVAWPMVQAGLSTVCCVLPLLFVATYSSSVFVTAIILVVLFGVLHGLFILPAFLSLLPEWLVSNRCCKRNENTDFSKKNAIASSSTESD